MCIGDGYLIYYVVDVSTFELNGFEISILREYFSEVRRISFLTAVRDT